MMESKLVLKFMDGRIKKGVSDDFLLLRESFHLRETPRTGNHEQVRLSDLKAIFFVADYQGNPRFRECKAARRPTYHRRIAVRFHDGEEIVGYTDDDVDRSEVIRMAPTDPLSNNTLIFVVKKNTISIQLVEI